MTVQHYTYNADTQNLVLLTATGRSIISISGNIAKRIFEKMHANPQGVTDMTAIQLEAKIKNLNDWLFAHEPLKENPFYSHDYRVKLHSRDYYVSKLIDLEESQLKTIKA